MFISWKKKYSESDFNYILPSCLLLLLSSSSQLLYGVLFSEKLVQLVILTIKSSSYLWAKVVYLRFLFAHRTLERHQDVFLSGECCCHETSCERAHSPQISCLKVSSSILSYGNDPQHIAVVDSDSQALHVNSMALSLGFMKLWLTRFLFSKHAHVFDQNTLKWLSGCSV